MGTMVEDLLKLSRIESGAVPMEMETVKAASILSDVTTACQPQTAAHNLTLETDIDPALTVRAIPTSSGRFSATSSRTPAATLPKAPPSRFPAGSASTTTGCRKRCS